MDNDSKKPDAGAQNEFEIPDLSEVVADLGIDAETVEKSEPAPKRAMTASAELGEWIVPTDDIRDLEPKKRKRRRKKAENNNSTAEALEVIVTEAEEKSETTGVDDEISKSDESVRIEAPTSTDTLTDSAEDKSSESQADEMQADDKSDDVDEKSDNSDTDTAAVHDAENAERNADNTDASSAMSGTLPNKPDEANSDKEAEYEKLHSSQAFVTEVADSVSDAVGEDDADSASDALDKDDADGESDVNAEADAIVTDEVTENTTVEAVDTNDKTAENNEPGDTTSDENETDSNTVISLETDTDDAENKSLADVDDTLPCRDPEATDLDDGGSDESVEVPSFPDSLDDLKTEEDALSEENAEKEAPAFVPREYKFPDNALSPEEPIHDDSIVKDLLGDPLTDEPYVAATMGDAPVGDSTDERATTENEQGAAGSEEKYDPEKPRRIDGVFDFVELVIFTLVAVLFITTFFVKHAVVEGSSMYSTLYPNDVLLISDVFYKPSRGDIVVVEDHTLEREDMHKPLVKRVIAVEGQLVTVTRDAIYVNSEKLDEPYVFTDMLDYEYDLVPGHSLQSNPTFFANSEYYTFIVPEGEIFVMGDHRNNSTDSRDVGTIREDAVLGRAIIRIYPFDRFGIIDD